MKSIQYHFQKLFIFAVSSSIALPPTVPVLKQFSSDQQNDDGDQAETGDASYSFNIDTDSYKRQETSDARGNIKGSYSYSNKAGTHDLAYVAGENTGFVAVSGSLAIPSGLGGNTQRSQGYIYRSPTTLSSTVNPDGSYSFGYSTPDVSQQQSREEGSYSYSNFPGTKDLRYTAGPDTGFAATGGSLSQPDGLGTQSTSSQGYTYSFPITRGDTSPPTSLSSTVNQDGSYSFGYSTSDASQQQSGDANGNVKGSYSYRNSAGTHDLSYTAGSGTGFVATGGSLSRPNGQSTLPNSQISPNTYSQGATYGSSSTPVDGSYKFEYSTDDSSRKEVSDANGNVEGRYSYRNQAGNHDLSYIAGSSTGFQVTGGSLSAPNGLSNSNDNTLSTNSYNSPQAAPSANTYSTPQQVDLANTGDASYSFSIDASNYKRTETSDANGNVKGSFSYKNSAGTHDLSFVAGSATGFQPTGGSLASPNNIPAGLSYSSRSPLTSSSTIANNDDEQSSWQHDEKRFRANGGSLSISPGLNDPQLRSGASTPTDTYSSGADQVLPSSKNTYRIGNVVVNSYLPPSNEKRKFGYIFDTKY